MKNSEAYKKTCEERGEEVDQEFLKTFEFWESVKEKRKHSSTNKTKPADETKKGKSNFYGDCDSPYTMENSTATFLYIVVMVVGTLFKDRWLIYIVATIIYLSFITRHSGKK